MIITMEDYLQHYGIPRKSGRYPWGSGEDPYQSNASFLGMVKGMREEGMTPKEIADSLGITTTELRARNSIARNENRQADIHTALKLKDKGWSNQAIGDRLQVSAGTVANLLAPGAADKAKVLDATADMLKTQIDNKGVVDIGTGVEHHLGISDNKLSNAVAKLEAQGYKKHYIKVPQLGTQHETSVKVMTPPGVSYSELMKDKYNIQQVTDVYTEDGGRTWANMRPPESIDSSRVEVNYSEKNSKGEEIGGGLADGVIYVRPGVEDVSLGDSRYAQVRIAVDGTHYLKGMAVYKDDLPPGVDLLFNSNKSRDEVSNKLETMKPMARDADGNIDKDNPFGATIKPGGQHGVMNVVNEEGTWDTWSRTLSSQFLSKQNPKLAREQLGMTFERRTDALDEIMSLTNPTVRKHLLENFAEDVDSAAVQLKAAALPRQATSVLLPLPKMKETEVFAPNLNNGDRVVLVRHPHGGIFEIPELVVNNRNPDGKKIIGSDAPDAIGINPKVAEKLSGADFDGDTVLVINNNSGKVKTAPTLEGLKDFDPRREYPPTETSTKMTSAGTQFHMGNVSNLITDMTIQNASTDELARAVRHSMVVIDAEKKGLDYKLSAEKNGIKALKAKYQSGPSGGASTIISRKKRKINVPERKMGFKVDPETGKKIFTETGASYVNKDGETVQRTTRVKELAEVDDANELSSGTVIEREYANHSNKLKALANTARKEAVNTKPNPYSPSARETYREEVATLRSKLNTAMSNAPRERQAQIVANAQYQNKLASNPDMDKDEKKKAKYQILAEARVRTGAKKELVDITEKEWEAIQAGAVSPNMLGDILKNSDIEQIKKYATPKSKPTMTTAKVSRARSMAAAGYTQAEIAEQLGVSVSTIKNAISEGG